MTRVIPLHVRARLSATASMLSQGINSLTNLAMAAMISHVTTPGQLGAWAVLFAGYGLLLQLSRALVVTPVLVHVDVGERVPRWLSDQACSSAAAVGFVGGLVLVAVTLVLPRALWGAGALLAVGLPLLLVQDALRNEAVRNALGWWAACLDLGWAAVQASTIAVLIKLDAAGTTGLTGAWVLGGALAGLGGLLVARRRLSPDAVRAFAADNREASLKLALESVMGTGVLLLVPPLLVLVSGFAVAGAVRAGQTVLGPITFLMAGLLPLLTTAAVARARAGRGAGSLVVLASVATVTLSVAIGVLVTIDPSVGVLLAGNSWSLVYAILVPLVVASALRGPIAVVPAVMRGHRLFDRVILLRFRTSLPAVAVPLLGAAFWGLQGAAWGMAVAAVVNTAQSLRAYRRCFAKEG